MFDKNVYKMTVVCCNYAVASYLPCFHAPGNRRRAFHWEKYRRSAGDSCIANEPPENAQWNTPLVELFDVEYYRDLEMWVRSLKVLKVVPFENTFASLGDSHRHRLRGGDGGDRPRIQNSAGATPPQSLGRWPR